MNRNVSCSVEPAQPLWFSYNLVDSLCPDPAEDILRTGTSLIFPSRLHQRVKTHDIYNVQYQVQYFSVFLLTTCSSQDGLPCRSRSISRSLSSTVPLFLEQTARGFSFSQQNQC